MKQEPAHKLISIGLEVKLRTWKYKDGQWHVNQGFTASAVTMIVKSTACIKRAVKGMPEMKSMITTKKHEGSVKQDGEKKKKQTNAVV